MLVTIVTGILFCCVFMYLFYSNFSIFDLKIHIVDNFITGVEFLPKTPRLDNVINPNNKLAHDIVNQLNQYLIDSKFRFDLPLKIDGTSHQKKVWQQMLAIPSGGTVSYKYIANTISSIPRAVGNACGSNKIGLFIPCHRVVNQNGKLGGFMQSSASDKLDIKRWLLKHENA